MLTGPLSWQDLALVTATLPNPPGATGVSWASPEQTRIMLHSASFILTADANVANRYVVIAAYHGGTRFSECPAPGPQVASEAITYRAAPCILGIDESADQQRMWFPITEHLILEWNHRLAITAYNLQAGDLFTSIVIRYYQAKPR